MEETVFEKGRLSIENLIELQYVEKYKNYLKF